MIFPDMKEIQFSGVQSHGGLVARDELGFFVLPFHKPLQIRMVIPDVELMLGSFQIMAPLFQGTNDGEHLLVHHRVVSFFQAHGV